MMEISTSTHLSGALLGKVAVVIGGGSGIGLASAKQLAALGACCVLAGRRSSEELQAICASLPGEGHIGISVNIGDSCSIVAMRDQIESRFGRLDILVNSGGFTKVIPHTDLEGLDDELIDRMFAVNWRGVFATIRALEPMLRANGTGFIANLSSIAATTGIGSNIAYCAVKAATDSMTATLARVLAPEVRIVSISPGVVDTQFVPGRDDEWKRRQSESAPLKHLVTPDDVAQAIIAALLLLPATTGSVIQVDSGRHL
jgi:3-oxoacyl-[acyl-carrier protein] reductase